MKNITVLGTGVLGAQIAYQTAYKGFHVVAYDVNDEALEAARERTSRLAERYVAEVEGAAGGAADEALGRLTYSSDLGSAAADADLIIEAIPEKLELKRDVWAQLGALAPASTIFATNSSTLLPSQMADATGRPQRFLALHFANQIWLRNTAEVMGTDETDPQVFQQVVRFARDIGMVPIEIHQEQPGYVLNSLLVPLLNAASGLLMKGVASPEDIDATWKVGTGAPNGPFEIYDVVGLTTAYNISSAGGPEQQEFARYLKENYLDKGKLGVGTGEGFYTYPRD